MNETENTGRTVIRPVVRNQNIKLNDAILIAGSSGPGIVGVTSASYIIEQQKMHQIAYVDSDFIAPGVMYIGGRLRHPFRIYANNEGNACVLVCDAPDILSGIRSLLSSVVMWAKNNNVREVIVLEGTVVPSFPPEGRKPIVMSSDGQSDDHGYIRHIKSKIENVPPASREFQADSLRLVFQMEFRALVYWCHQYRGSQTPRGRQSS